MDRYTYVSSIKCFVEAKKLFNGLKYALSITDSTTTLLPPVGRLFINMILNKVVFDDKSDIQALNFCILKEVLDKLEPSSFVMNNNFMKVTLVNNSFYLSKLVCFTLTIGKLSTYYVFIIFNTKVPIVLIKNNVIQDFKLNIPDFNNITHTIIAINRVISI